VRVLTSSRATLANHIWVLGFCEVVFVMHRHCQRSKASFSDSGGCGEREQNDTAQKVITFADSLILSISRT